MASLLVDTIAIDEPAKEHNVPYFSSSSSWFGPGLQNLKRGDDVGTLAGAAVWAFAHTSPGQPTRSFYGVHVMEALVNLMGTGCETVSRIQTKDAALVTCVWKDGRVGTCRDIRATRPPFNAIAFSTKGIVQAKQWGDYKGLCNEIATFFKTRKPSFSLDETLEIMAIIEAAD